MVIGARNAALARQYKRLGFTDLAGGAMVPLAHAADLPHRVLAFDVVSAERNWFAVRHPLYEFMVRHYHPDIRPFAAEARQGQRRSRRRPGVRCTRRAVPQARRDDGQQLALGERLAEEVIHAGALACFGGRPSRCLP